MSDTLEKQVGKLTKKLAAISLIDAKRSGAYALNRVGVRAKSQIVKAVSQEVKIPQKQIRKKVYLARATAKKQKAKIKAYRRGIPVISLGTASSVSKGKNKGAVKVGGKSYPGAFIGQIRRNGSWQLMKRKGSARYPVEVLKVAVAGAIDRHSEPITKRLMKTDYGKILAADLNYRIAKRAGK